MTHPSLFRPDDLRALEDRVRGLSPTAEARWGKMDVAQMLAHCRVGLRLAAGETRIRRAFIGILFGRMAKRSMLGEKPFSKGLPTDASFRIRDRRDFAAERDGLLAQIERAARAGPAGFSTAPHPFFGPLAPSEWDTLTCKHLDHHLRQFGA